MSTRTLSRANHQCARALRRTASPRRGCHPFSCLWHRRFDTRNIPLRTLAQSAFMSLTSTPEHEPPSRPGWDADDLCIRQAVTRAGISLESHRHGCVIVAPRLSGRTTMLRALSSSHPGAALWVAGSGGDVTGVFGGLLTGGDAGAEPRAVEGLIRAELNRGGRVGRRGGCGPGACAGRHRRRSVRDGAAHRADGHRHPGRCGAASLPSSRRTGRQRRGLRAGATSRRSSVGSALRGCTHVGNCCRRA